MTNPCLQIDKTRVMQAWFAYSVVCDRELGGLRNSPMSGTDKVNYIQIEKEDNSATGGNLINVQNIGFVRYNLDRRREK
ncbi:MAG TPA: hypothetical protein PK883_09835 [Anaerolineaceae bacterium]|nr:hypothetical protein [Anaerolineaceae bacterium]